MTNTKKFFALLICFMMICTVAITGAEETDPQDNNGTAGTQGTIDHGIYVGHANTIRIGKTIEVTNPDSQVTSVYGPNINYSYRILPVPEEPSYTVSDEANTVSVLPGIAAAVGTPVTLSFESSMVALSGGKGNVSGYAELTFDPSKFDKPGVYRYSITDTTSAETLWSAGIIRKSEPKNVYYLDVYVAYQAAGAQELEIQGYAFFGDNANIDTDTSKLSQFEPGNADNATIATQPTALQGDVYPTFNVEVTQKVAGTMPDPLHEFPISATVSNHSTDSNSNVAFYSGASFDSAELIQGTAVTATLANGEKLYLYGLNARATVQYTETNDTESTYTISAKKGSSESGLVEAATVVPERTCNTNELAITDWPAAATSAGVLSSVTLDADHKIITFINELNAISPTGIIRYVTPYALMLMFAFFFILLMKNRRREAEES